MGFCKLFRRLHNPRDDSWVVFVQATERLPWIQTQIIAHAQANSILFSKNKREKKTQTTNDKQTPTTNKHKQTQAQQTANCKHTCFGVEEVVYFSVAVPVVHADHGTVTKIISKKCLDPSLDHGLQLSQKTPNEILERLKERPIRYLFVATWSEMTNMCTKVPHKLVPALTRDVVPRATLSAVCIRISSALRILWYIHVHVQLCLEA